MLRVGLTGGIGSGKTTVSDRFSALGIPVIDADSIAYELTQKGGAGYEAIIEEFGPEVTTPEGELDRRRLRQIVFSDPQQLARLEAILHPLVRQRITQRLDQLEQETNAPYCIISVPLIIEADMLDLVDRLIVVDVPEEVQVARASQRDGTSEAEIARILKRQASRAQRLAAADLVIDNSGDLASTQRQIEAIDALLRQHTQS